jgi:hypothetical protein
MKGKKVKNQYNAYKEGKVSEDEIIADLISVLELNEDIREKHHALDYLMEFEKLPTDYLNYFSDMLVFEEQEEAILEKTFPILLKFYPELAVSRLEYFLEHNKEERYKSLVLELIDEYYHPSLEVLIDKFKNTSND